MPLLQPFRLLINTPHLAESLEAPIAAGWAAPSPSSRLSHLSGRGREGRWGLGSKEAPKVVGGMGFPFDLSHGHRFPAVLMPGPHVLSAP